MAFWTLTFPHPKKIDDIMFNGATALLIPHNSLRAKQMTFKVSFKKMTRSDHRIKIFTATQEERKILLRGKMLTWVIFSIWISIFHSIWINSKLKSRHNLKLPNI